MTAITQVQLVAPVQMATSDTVLYTAPALTTAKVGRAVFCNTTASPVTITVYVTTGGVGAAATTLISARSVAPGETYVSPELAGAVLQAGTALRGLASAGTAITAAAWGVTIV